MSAPPLRVVRRVAELRAVIADWRAAGETVGLVPTMGALHAGHMALVARARAETARTIVTLFVNPTQFGANEDLAGYPRDEAGDRLRLEAAGVDLLFAPATTEIYPPDFATTVAVAGLTEHLCGPFRPGHFAGVATVVTKLLLQALPDAAYFGEKDFQQLQVIRRLARDLDMPTHIVGVPTVRDADGLALSSRNRNLSAAERAAAAALPRVVHRIAARLGGGAAVVEECAWGRAELLRAGFTGVDYVEACDAGTLRPVPSVGAAPVRVFAAAWLGRTRLIDNMAVALSAAGARSAG